jgi:F-type H+-transporting ATPase subunit delta
MSAVGLRYARAFVDVVVADKLDAAKTLEQLQSIATSARESAPLRTVWESPAIPAEQKRGLLDAIAKREGISRMVRNFIAVLIDHRRIGLLDEITKEFEQELYARLGVTEAEITSARELSDQEKGLLEAQVEKLTGKKVRARYRRDETLLGGAVVQIGSTIYDGSVKGQLERIREELAAS